MRAAAFATVTLILAALSACGSKVPPAAPPAAQARAASPWPALRDEIIEGYFLIRPGTAVYQGRHEYDGQLTDWSREGIASSNRWLREQLTRIDALPGASLDAAERFERGNLRQVIAGELFWAEAAQEPFRNPTTYIDGIDPSPYLERAYAPLATRLASYIKYLQAVPRAMQQARGNLRLPLPRTFVERAVPGFAGFADFYESDARAVFAAVKDGALRAQLDAATAEAAKATRAMAAWLSQQRATANEDFALGTELFVAMLRETEGVTTPLEQLERTGRADLERNLAALRAACEAYARGASLPDCVARTARDKPAEGPVVAARGMLASLRQFILDKELMSIPSEEQALIAEAPPYQRANAAYINVPGPYEKGMPSIYYIAPPDPKWSRKEQDAYIPSRVTLLFTTTHEVWPGHFLQFLVSNRAPSVVGRAFVGYAYAEGWAHYSEELMWEAGLGDGDPATHIGQLGDALLRDARFLSAIGLHTGGMTVAQSEKMFREQAFKDPGNSRQQAARGTYDPAYLNYTLGKLIIRKMREDYSASRGGRAAWKTFHDQFLGYGGASLPLARREMLGNDAGPLL